MNEPVKKLATAIIIQAAKDVQTYSPQKKTRDLYLDAVDFFNTEWYDDLCFMSGVSASYIRKLIYKKRVQKAKQWKNIKNIDDSELLEAFEKR